MIEALARFTQRERDIHRGRTRPSASGPTTRTTRSGRRWPLPQSPIQPRSQLHPRHYRGDQPRCPKLRAEPNLKTGDDIVQHAMQHHSNSCPSSSANSWREAEAAAFQRSGTGCGGVSSRPTWATGPVSSAVVHVSTAARAPQSGQAEDRAGADGGSGPARRGPVASHLRGADVQEAGDCDFFAFSATSSGPTGVGVLFGRGRMLEQMRFKVRGMHRPRYAWRVYRDQPPAKFEPVRTMKPE